MLAGLFSGRRLLGGAILSSGALASALQLPHGRTALAQPRVRTTTTAARTAGEGDPHLWLEQIEDEAALAWCRAHNERTVRTLGDPKRSDAYRKILDIADSKEKIAYVSRIGGRSGDEAANVYYNFWQDADHVRGVWRRTSLASYRSAQPEWETVIDLDALNAAEALPEGGQFVWHGSSVLDEGSSSQRWDRALVFLSPGGTDAQVVREFDLLSRTFVPCDGVSSGFRTDVAAKCDVGYRRRDEVLIGTDFDGTGATLTDSGYPRIVKSWRRGTPLEEATTVFEVEQSDLAAAQYAYFERDGRAHEFQLRQISFYQSEQFYRSPDLSLAADDDKTPFVKLDIPADTSLGTFADQATLQLRSPWAPPNAPGGKTYPAGSLLAAPLAEAVAGNWSRATCLFEPQTDGSDSLDDVTATKNYLILKVSEHVRTKLHSWRLDDAHGWVADAEGGGQLSPAGEDWSVAPIWTDDSDEVWMSRSGFLVPSTLERASAADGLHSGASRELLKQLPAYFDSSGLQCSQYFATSDDGTRVPYFLLAPKDMVLDGSHPTILEGYGGFEIALTPGYSGSVGAAWLARGGVKAVANIRGGGEYGPRWHQAALREKRQRSYEDFEAVGRDLISRGVCSPPTLGCVGGSNGGLLVGNMITREGRNLFGAAVCQVPLLDMARYHLLLAGASWVEEYGDPEEDGVWETYLAAISPYHRLRGGGHLEAGGGCPKVLFTSSTKDDRVHPGHARKMVEALQTEVPAALGGGVENVLYWENIEGGHGGAADNQQMAYMWALTYNFFWEALGGTSERAGRSEGP